MGFTKITAAHTCWSYRKTYDCLACEQAADFAYERRQAEHEHRDDLPWEAIHDGWYGEEDCR